MIKKYNRSAADTNLRDKTSLRPAFILQKVVTFLVEEIFKTHWPVRSKRLLLFDFISDRLRTVNQDFKIMFSFHTAFQSLPETIRAYELMCRFYLAVLNPLRACKDFDEAIWSDQFIEVISTLTECYRTALRLSKKFPLSGENPIIYNSPNFITHLRYILILKAFEDTPVFMGIFEQFRALAPELALSEKMSIVLSVFESNKSEDYSRLFELITSSPPLTSTLLSHKPFLMNARVEYWHQIHKICENDPFAKNSYLTSALLFNNESERKGFETWMEKSNLKSKNRGAIKPYLTTIAVKPLYYIQKALESQAFMNWISEPEGNDGVSVEARTIPVSSSVRKQSKLSEISLPEPEKPLPSESKPKSQPKETPKPKSPPVDKEALRKKAVLKCLDVFSKTEEHMIIKLAKKKIAFWKIAAVVKKEEQLKSLLNFKEKRKLHVRTNVFKELQRIAAMMKARKLYLKQLPPIESTSSSVFLTPRVVNNFPSSYLHYIIHSHLQETKKLCPSIFSSGGATKFRILVVFLNYEADAETAEEIYNILFGESFYHSPDISLKILNRSLLSEFLESPMYYDICIIVNINTKINSEKVVESIITSATKVNPLLTLPDTKSYIPVAFRLSMNTHLIIDINNSQGTIKCIESSTMKEEEIETHTVVKFPLFCFELLEKHFKLISSKVNRFREFFSFEGLRIYQPVNFAENLIDFLFKEAIDHKNFRTLIEAVLKLDFVQRKMENLSAKIQQSQKELKSSLFHRFVDSFFDQVSFSFDVSSKKTFIKKLYLEGESTAKKVSTSMKEEILEEIISTIRAPTFFIFIEIQDILTDTDLELIKSKADLFIKSLDSIKEKLSLVEGRKRTSHTIRKESEETPRQSFSENNSLLIKRNSPENMREDKYFLPFQVTLK